VREQTIPSSVKDSSGSATMEIQVAGVHLKLRSSHDEQTVRELVSLVDEKVKQALSSNSNISYQKALLLASLHIAEDFVFLKRAARQRLDQLENKTKSILSELDASPLTRMEVEA
jgi:cell division protein ZapA (FtsZ GTPase activity inhibitor)